MAERKIGNGAKRTLGVLGRKFRVSKQLGIGFLASVAISQHEKSVKQRPQASLQSKNNGDWADSLDDRPLGSVISQRLQRRIVGADGPLLSANQAGGDPGGRSEGSDGKHGEDLQPGDGLRQGGSKARLPKIVSIRFLPNSPPPVRHPDRTSPSCMLPRTMSTLSHLPLPPPSQRLQCLLTPCPSAHPSFHTTLLQNPSSQRRSTTFQSGHFTNVTPLPVSFPYQLPGKLGDDGKMVPAMGVEEWLTSQEPLERLSGEKDGLGVYGAKNRDWPVVLLGFSQKCLEDVVPHLDAGDARKIVEADYDAAVDSGKEKVENKVREELVGVLGGREVLMDLKEGEEEGSYLPWSLR